MIIPFFIPQGGCPHQCVFCDQKSITGQRSAPEPATLPQVIDRYLSTRKNDTPAEVAFFGGSFTALPVDRQRAYLEAIRPFVENGSIGSIRLSTRPDAITPPILDLLQQYRVGMVELGAQSLDDEVLQLAGRGHTAADTAHAVRMLREYGFSTGLQLMPGLPGDTAGRFRETVRRAIGLRPDIVRLYPALVIRDTPLARLYRSGRFTPLPLEDAVDWCRDALDRFEAAGIAVVRVGLQPTEELERPGTVLAGPWHPAFGQLVESARFLGSMSRLLAACEAPGPVAFAVHPADLSSAVGQHRRNIHALRDRFGREASIIADPAMPRGSIRTAPACCGRADEVS